MESTVPPKRILALAQLSLPSKNAVWRAGLVARDHGASLHVLHVVRDLREVAAAQAGLERLCEPLSERLGVVAEVEVVRGDLQREVTRAARDADLLVLASRSGNTLRERIAGAPLERVIRLSPIPTLVIKRHAAPPRDARRGDETLRGRYGRVLVSVDLARDAAGVIAAASCFSDDPAMEVFHAVSARRETSAAPRTQDAHPPQGTAIERARSSLKGLIAASGAHCSGATASVGFGAAAPLVLSRQRALSAELLAVGKRHRGLFADYFLGGITQQILADSRSDVLVVPKRLPRAPCHASSR
jgi:nucleotide-binding universal stress UspA family protein